MENKRLRELNEPSGQISQRIPALAEKAAVRHAAQTL
jgi:hypothetical protein